MILAAARWTRLPSFNLWVTDALATTTWAITITRPETTSKKSFRSPLWGGLSLRRSVPTEAESYDLVMLNDVIEHLHDSPRELLNDLIILIKPGGYLLITVPNLANIRKRVDLLRGRTNLARFTSFYWWPGPWRGNVREYVKEDLESLAQFLGLHLVELKSCHHMIYLLPAAARPAYRAVTCLFPGWRDSWLLLAHKASGWAPRRNLPPRRTGGRGVRDGKA